MTAFIHEKKPAHGATLSWLCRTDKHGLVLGQVMKATGGKANPKAVNEIVQRKLGL
jgi:Asp-tRNA(Asn)/Glu-tRNA(Gln) amidotransferase B subunit